MIWTSRWSVSQRTFYRQNLALRYTSFFLCKLPPPARPGGTSKNTPCSLARRHLPAPLKGLTKEIVPNRIHVPSLPQFPARPLREGTQCLPGINAPTPITWRSKHVSNLKQLFRTWHLPIFDGSHWISLL